MVAQTQILLLFSKHENSQLLHHHPSLPGLQDSDDTHPSTEPMSVQTCYFCPVASPWVIALDRFESLTAVMAAYREDARTESAHPNTSTRLTHRLYLLPYVYCRIIHLQGRELANKNKGAKIVVELVNFSWHVRSKNSVIFQIKCVFMQFGTVLLTSTVLR